MVYYKHDFSARRLHFMKEKEKDPVGSYIRGADGGRDDRVRARQYRICGHVFRHRKSFPRVRGARRIDDRRVPRNRGRHHPYAAARAGRARRLLDNGEDWLIGIYYSYITPSSTGGQPAQVVYLRRDKVSVGNSTAVLFVKFFAYQLAFVLCTVASLIYMYRV